MKITIGTSSNPNAVVRDVAVPPAEPDPRSFAERNREVLDAVAKNRRSRLRAIEGGKKP
jgi:hypothetical protein